MKIFIDADGCPVIRIAVRTAKEYNIPCIILCDTSHLKQLLLTKVQTVLISVWSA